MPSFLDKVVVGINKGVSTVGASSKAMVEKAKINTAINTLEGERTQLLQLLGQRVYDLFEETGEITVDKGITNFIAQIKQRIEFIAEKQVELKRIDDELKNVTGSGAANIADTSKCGQCGANVPYNNTFCSSCGSKMPEQPAVQQSAVCKGCGNEIAEGMMFCTGCGQKIES